MERAGQLLRAVRGCRRLLTSGAGGSGWHPGPGFGPGSARPGVPFPRAGGRASDMSIVGRRDEPTHAEYDPAHSTAAPPLVGRRGELGKLRGELDAVRASSPRLVILEGPAGVGK